MAKVSQSTVYHKLQATMQQLLHNLKTCIDSLKPRRYATIGPIGHHAVNQLIVLANSLI